MRIDRREFSRLLALGILGGSVASAHAQTVDDLFDVRTFRDLHLWVNSRDFQLLRQNYLENTYYPAQLEWGNIRLSNVGVRSRGSGSRNPVKLGLKVDVDRYVSGQRFLGLEEFVLDNLWQDPALIRESLAMSLFARLGQPAPREAFVRLFINNELQGVYAVVEAINPPFVSRTLGASGGYLFEYTWRRSFYGEYLGDALSPYAEILEPETHESEGQAALYSPIERMFREINGPDDSIWRESVERSVDLAQFLTHVAIEMFTSELDGLIGYAGMNNFYLHRASASAAHQFIPWDRDNAFQQIDSSVMLRATENVLFWRALQYPDLRAFYLQALEATARAAAQDGWLEAEVASRAALIDAAAREDSRKQFSTGSYDIGIEFLRAFARERPGNVIAQVNNLR